MKTQSKSVLAAVCLVAILALSASATAGVCKIGNTEYDTLQDAFYSKTNDSVSADFTVTLLTDIDITSRITIPSFNRKVCTVDGAGHAIRQAYGDGMFFAGVGFTYITFTNVTILGAGVANPYGASNTVGAFVNMRSQASRLTLESGCVVSNFANFASLLGTDDNLPSWNFIVMPGSVIACNNGSCIFRMYSQWQDGYSLKILGGEIFGNSGVIANLGGLFQSRTKPILTMEGGRIHDNTGTAVFRCGYGPIDIEVKGGEIFDNAGNVFGITADTQKSRPARVHISGGAIFGNLGYAVADSPYDSGYLATYLSGNPIIAGNSSDGLHGIYTTETEKWRMALEGDFTGFARFAGNNSVGVTNLASYAGVGNIHYSDDTAVYQDNSGRYRPKSAKISSAEYDTFAEALAAAADGDTIVLMRDCLIGASIVPPANKRITIDGRGYRMFRRGKNSLVKASEDGGNITFTDVELNEGYFTSRNAYTNHVDGVIVTTMDGVAATVTLGHGTVLVGGRGTNALVRVANGATVNLDGCVITGAVNRAIAASAGGTLGVKGATVVKDNAGGDIDVADGNILSMNGDLTGSVHVTVAGVEACEGQKFGTKTGGWAGEGNFVNGGSNPKLHVSAGGILAWCRRGLAVTFR